MADSSNMHYCIPLGRSILLFFPECLISEGGDKDAVDTYGYVVQVTIKHAQKSVAKELAEYFLAQYEITKAIESLVFAHIFTALPQEVRVRGPHYVVTGRRKPWAFGQALSLNWGDKMIRPCEDKWNFVFEVEEGHVVGGISDA